MAYRSIRQTWARRTTFTRSTGVEPESERDFDGLRRAAVKEQCSNIGIRRRRGVVCDRRLLMNCGPATRGRAHNEADKSSSSKVSQGNCDTGELRIRRLRHAG